LDADDSKFHCCVSGDGKIIVTMRGSFILEVFIVDAENDKFERRNKISLMTEIIASKQFPGFEFEKRDIMHNVRFDED
jgi:FAD synthase